MGIFSNFSREEINELNLTPDDGKKIKGVINETDELLGNAEEPVDEAKQILLRAAKKAKETKDNNQFLRKNKENAAEHDVVNNDKEKPGTYVARGSAEQLLYLTLVKMIPGLKISIQENLSMLDDGTDYININDESNEAILKSILENPVISFLADPSPLKFTDGKVLEQKGLLAPGTTERVIAQLCQKQVDRCNKILDNLPPEEDNEEYLNEKKDWEDHLKSISGDAGIQAMTDKEIEEIMRKIIQEQLENK